MAKKEEKKKKVMAKIAHFVQSYRYLFLRFRSVRQTHIIFVIFRFNKVEREHSILFKFWSYNIYHTPLYQVKNCYTFLFLLSWQTLSIYVVIDLWNMVAQFICCLKMDGNTIWQWMIRSDLSETSEVWHRSFLVSGRFIRTDSRYLNGTV